MKSHQPAAAPARTTVPPVAVTFVGGDAGTWCVESNTGVVGPALPVVPCVEVVEGDLSDSRSATWRLRGVVSSERYVERRERDVLVPIQPPLGREAATSAALIAITKSQEWWSLPQDERRAIFETRSGHIARSLAYLPRISRRLHHCRDLREAFDFLTWFEFAPVDGAAFEELTAALRATEEWTYVVAEVELRLTRS